MKRKRFVDMALLSVVSLTCFPWSFPAGQGELTTEFALAGIRDGLARSPDRFVAALVEVLSPPKCEGTEGAATCVQDVRLVRVLSARGPFVEGATMIVVGEGRVGSRTLGFFVPIPARSQVFGASFLSARTGEAEVRVFVEALESAGVARPVA